MTVHWESEICYYTIYSGQANYTIKIKTIHKVSSRSNTSVFTDKPNLITLFGSALLSFGSSPTSYQISPAECFAASQNQYGQTILFILYLKPVLPRKKKSLLLNVPVHPVVQARNREDICYGLHVCVPYKAQILKRNPIWRWVLYEVISS